MGWTMRVQIPAEATYFSLLQNVSTGSGAHPTSYPIGTVVISREVKRLDGDVDFSLPRSAQVKNCVAVPLFPLFAFLVWTGKTLPSCLFT